MLFALSSFLATCARFRHNIFLHFPPFSYNLNCLDSYLVHSSCNKTSHSIFPYLPHSSRLLEISRTDCREVAAATHYRRIYRGIRSPGANPFIIGVTIITYREMGSEHPSQCCNLYIVLPAVMGHPGRCHHSPNSHFRKMIKNFRLVVKIIPLTA